MTAPIKCFFFSRFKLHLRPRARATTSISDEIPPLPPGKTAVDVFADFLRYMKACAKVYVEETHLGGADFWKSGKEEYILSHPNAWEGAQQTLMRKAAVQAGLVPDTPDGQSRISFITEGEASLNFCVDRGFMDDSVRVSRVFLLGNVFGLTSFVSAAMASRLSMPEVAPWILAHIQSDQFRGMNSRRSLRLGVSAIHAGDV